MKNIVNDPIRLPARITCTSCARAPPVNLVAAGLEFPGPLLRRPADNLSRQFLLCHSKCSKTLASLCHRVSRLEEACLRTPQWCLAVGYSPVSPPHLCVNINVIMTHGEGLLPCYEACLIHINVATLGS